MSKSQKTETNLSKCIVKNMDRYWLGTICQISGLSELRRQPMAAPIHVRISPRVEDGGSSDKTREDKTAGG